MALDSQAIGYRLALSDLKFFFKSKGRGRLIGYSPSGYKRQARGLPPLDISPNVRLLWQSLPWTSCRRLMNFPYSTLHSNKADFLTPRVIPSFSVHNPMDISFTKQLPVLSIGVFPDDEWDFSAPK
jgi:hypothetical protein